MKTFTVNDLSDYLNRTNTPGFFNQTGPGSYDLYVLQDDRERVEEDLAGHFPISVSVTVCGVQSKSEMRRINIQRQSRLAPVSDDGITKVGLDNHGLPIRELNQMLGVDKWMHREDKKDFKVINGTHLKSLLGPSSKKTIET